MQGRISIAFFGFLTEGYREKRQTFSDICVQQKDNRQQSTLAVRVIPAGYGSSQALERVSQRGCWISIPRDFQTQVAVALSNLS